MNPQRIDISPAILYWGTPVCLITTTNPDGTYNIGPMSSVFLARPRLHASPRSWKPDHPEYPTDETLHTLFEGQPFHGSVFVFEVRIVNVKIYRHLKLEGHRNHVDADKWKPVIMMFCESYGLTSGKLAESNLAKPNEEMYRGIMGTTKDPLTEMELEG